jgi:asparagine synthase (glutamine-hydrolysing)
MCGFFLSNSIQVNKQDLPKIRERVGFRGPDGESGLIDHCGWKLYHARLAIIAPDDKFNQPYMNESGSILVFNGEILNYKELSRKYSIQDNSSDTHVLSELLEIDSFKISELEGFFAFVLIDRFGKLKRCARDRFGVKPINYYEDSQGGITISSEASIISDIFDLGYDQDAINEYKVFRAPIFQGSFFKNINAITPGSCLVSGQFFDSIDFVSDKYASKEEIINDIESAIIKSIDSRMISDTPVGLLFSGGIDSNIINQYSRSEISRFTGGFKNDYDFEYARNNPVESNLVRVSNDVFIERLNSMIKLRKEPLSVPNEVILSFLAQKWSEKGGKVLLSGEAADELFAGYDRIYNWALNKDKFNSKEFLDLYAYVEYSKIDKKIVEMTDNFFKEIQDLCVFEQVRQFFIKKHLPVLFRRLDFALMYSGVEGREPLASSFMFEVAMKCCPTDLFYKKLGKFPLRHLASKKLGDKFAYSPKVGFPIDLGLIFNNKTTSDKFSNYSLWIDENLRRLEL